MAIIALRNGVVFTEINRFILGDLLDLMRDELLPDDGEALYKVDQAEAFSALQLDLYEPAIADRLEKVLLRVAHAVVDGRQAPPSEFFQDPQKRAMFMRSMRKLLKTMVHPVEGGPPQ
ncbi:MAG TPA: hypothetical protein VFA20_09575 [Myxococcaceae bacterium]|nr:hypothetical protein [Myxococcaceae bacterium]